jgi:hypothetical protein
MADSFDDDGFSLKPKNLNDDHWFYENKKGLTVAYRAHGTMQSIVGIVEIPWSKLKPAIERHQKYERRRTRRRASK